MLVEDQIILDGRYKVVKRLGSGAFGEIFKGKFRFCDPDLVHHPSHDREKEEFNLNNPIVEKVRTGEFFAAKIVCVLSEDSIKKKHFSV